jgi:GTP-binding protein EngB required for normal cell division
MRELQLAAPDGIDMRSLTVVVDELLMLISETSEYHAETTDVKAIMDEAQRIVLKIHRRIHAAARRYVVAVVGLTNVGKSTLLNALLEHELAPRRNGPCTAIPIEFSFAESPCLTAFHQGLQRHVWHPSGMDEMRQRLEGLAAESGDESCRNFRKVSVEAPLELLRNGLIIADTPGFGAAQQAASAGSHEHSLREYLNKEVAQVFWVVLAEQGIGKAETTFHDKFFADTCDDVIITGSEDWDQKDRDRFKKRFSQVFGQKLPNFHFASGLEGLKARRSHDRLGLGLSGITDLECRIRELAAPAGRTSAACTTLLNLCEAIRDWLVEFRDDRGQRLSPWWRPDSWDRWREAAKTIPLADRLAQILELHE